MKAIISRTTNGAWVRFVDPDAEGDTHTDRSYEFGSSRDGDSFKSACSMFWDILEMMGWSDGRYDRERIQIRIVHGDKFSHSAEDPQDKCEICKENSFD